jgi:hypothetical protein
VSKHPARTSLPTELSLALRPRTLAISMSVRKCLGSCAFPLQHWASPRLLDHSNYLLNSPTCYGCHDTLILEQLSPSLLGHLAPLAYSLRTVAIFLLEWSRSPVGSSAALRLQRALRRSFPSWGRSSSSAATCALLTFDVPQPGSSSTLHGATSSPTLRRLYQSLQYRPVQWAHLHCARPNPSSSNGSCSQTRSG